MAKKDTVTLTTCRAVLSYPHLKEPAINDKNVERFEVQLVFEPEGDLGPLKQLVLDCAQANIPDFKTAKWRKPLKDAGAKTDTDKTDDENWPYLPGRKFIVARSKFRPTLVDNDVKEVGLSRIPEVFYPGCIVLAEVSCWYYPEKKNPPSMQGISFNIHSLQRVGKGRKLSKIGGADVSKIYTKVAEDESAEDAFDSVEDIEDPFE